MHILIINHIHHILNKLGKYNVEVDKICNHNGMPGCLHVCAPYKPNNIYGKTTMRTTNGFAIHEAIILAVRSKVAARYIYMNATLCLQIYADMRRSQLNCYCDL